MQQGIQTSFTDILLNININPHALAFFVSFTEYVFSSKHGARKRIVSGVPRSVAICPTVISLPLYTVTIIPLYCTGGTIAAYFAHPFMQAGSYYLHI